MYSTLERATTGNQSVSLLLPPSLGWVSWLPPEILVRSASCCGRVGERLAPADVGLPPGIRRRTAGLRREEVAQLASLSVTYYTFLEQGRQARPSEQVLDALAAALRMTPAERRYLLSLAYGPETPRPAARPARRRRPSGSARVSPISYGAWSRAHPGQGPLLGRARRQPGRT